MSSTSHTDHDAAWLPVLEPRLGAAVRILGRAPLTGGYVADSVERVELAVGGRERTVVLKAAGPVEVAAMRAVAVVAAAPQALAIGPDWLVLPFVDAPPLAPADPVPDPSGALAAVHAHWRGRRPRGVPVVDASWWAALCDHTLVAVRGGLARAGGREFADAERALVPGGPHPRSRAR